jgi:hypothetical protein
MFDTISTGVRSQVVNPSNCNLRPDTCFGFKRFNLPGIIFDPFKIGERYSSPQKYVPCSLLYTCAKACSSIASILALIWSSLLCFRVIALAGHSQMQIPQPRQADGGISDT